MKSSFLKDEMRCSLLSNDNGDIMIVHDKPLKSQIQWVEFNPNDVTLFLVYEDGTNQRLGIKIPQDMIEDIKKGTSIKINQIENKTIKTTQETSIIIQDY